MLQDANSQISTKFQFPSSKIAEFMSNITTIIWNPVLCLKCWDWGFGIWDSMLSGAVRHGFAIKMEKENNSLF